MCAAPYGALSPDRVNVRIGCRHRDFDTRSGTLDMAIPKLRSGSCPDWLLECRRWAEAALMTVVATCSPARVPAQQMEKLAESLGITRLSRSQVSVMAAEPKPRRPAVSRAAPADADSQQPDRIKITYELKPSHPNRAHWPRRERGGNRGWSAGAVDHPLR